MFIAAPSGAGEQRDHADDERALLEAAECGNVAGRECLHVVLARLIRASPAPAAWRAPRPVRLRRIAAGNVRRCGVLTELQGADVGDHAQRSRAESCMR